jgi:hypothetical protein
VAGRRETELNRRFAPDVYLGVAEIRGSDRRVCDHLLVMRRMTAGGGYPRWSWRGRRWTATCAGWHGAVRGTDPGRVACLRARQGDGQTAAEAWQLAGMTLGHLRAGAVTLVLVGGLPGAGKTTLAGALADCLGVQS